MSVLLISDDLVQKSITATECVDAVEEGFRLQASGSVVSTYANMAYQAGAAGFHLYSAYVPGYGLGTKILGAYEENPDKGEPYIHATVVLVDPETGRPEVFLDGRYLTALRTAAAVALAARYLSRRDSATLGILGTGLQARTHLLCHLVVRPFERVIVWGRTPEHVETYVSEMASRTSVPISALPTPEAVCAEADVIACTTRARQPLFSSDVVQAGTHIGVAGPLRREGAEIPLDLLRRGHLFVDDIDKFIHLWEPGSAPPVEAELGEIILTGRGERVSNGAVTIFKPVGMAFEDVVSARIVANHVRHHVGGQEIAW